MAPAHPGNVPRDEDTLVIPDEWQPNIHVWRGSALAHGVSVDTDAAERMRHRVHAMAPLVECAVGDGALVDAARAHLGGEANPVGAAVLANLLAELRKWANANAEWWMSADEVAALADLWAVDHGIVFAATAAAELGHVLVFRGQTESDPHRVTVAPHNVWPGALFGGGITKQVLRRVRALLAVASDADYRDAVTALANRQRDELQATVAAYLVPTETPWVDRLCAGPISGGLREDEPNLLLLSVNSVEQLDRLRSTRSLNYLRDHEILHTATARIGLAIAPVVVSLLDALSEPDTVRHLLSVLGRLPSDEAFDLMVARLSRPQVHDAVREAMRRYPVRALRRLAEAGSGPQPIAMFAARLLRDHLAAHPELAAVLPSLSDGQRAAVSTVDEAANWLAEAPADALPRLLVEPPWTRERKVSKPVVVKGLVADVEPAIRWADGEHQRWAATRTDYGQEFASSRSPERWAELVENLRLGKLHPVDAPRLFLDGPDELVRPLLSGWQPEPWWRFNTNEWMRLVVARFGLDALPAVLALGRSQPSVCADLLLPYVSTEVAELMARWLHLRSVRTVARTWFRRHRTAAVRALVPVALGKAGKQRRDAEAALRFIATTGTPDDVVGIANDHGAKAAEAIAACLEFDPLDELPKVIPDAADGVDRSLLPQVLLRGRRQALPPSAVDHLLTMLAMSWPHGRYAGLDVVIEHCDAASLAEFAWALFDQTRDNWQFDETKNDWAFGALGWLGNDDTVRRLTPLIRAWPGDGKHHKAVIGLDVLVSIGTETALVHLNSIAQRAKFKGLRTKAQGKIAELAADLGLTAEQLADRLVPDFDLDATGSLVLDYGPRQFTVGFDEHLKPFVADETGKRLKALPKPGARDDQNLAPAAHQRFTALKKDVRTVAADQIRRLEHAMITQRRWRATEFHDLFVNHPLLWHITRRLVWSVSFPGDETSGAFRIAEDRTLADVNDNTLTLPDTASVGIAHPVHLGDAVTAWAEVFADYALPQPFPQLGRPVHRLTEDEAASTELKRFHGITVPTTKLIGLERRGWVRAEDKNNGGEYWISRPVPGYRAVVVNISPGIVLQALDAYPEQRIERVWLNDQPGGHPFPHPTLPFGELDPLTASEVLADLTALTAAE